MNKNDKARRIDPGAMTTDLSTGTIGPEDAEILDLYGDEGYLMKLRAALPDMDDDDFDRFVASMKSSLAPEDVED